MYEIELSLLQTVTLAAVVYYAGVLLRREVPLLNRLNIPSAVIGGLLFALVVFVLRDRVLNLRLDTSTQPLLSVAFFTSIVASRLLAMMGRKRGRASAGGAAPSQSTAGSSRSSSVCPATAPSRSRRSVAGRPSARARAFRLGR